MGVPKAVEMAAGAPIFWSREVISTMNCSWHVCTLSV